MIRILIILLGFSVCAASAATFDEANRLYEQRKYAEAARAYESLLAGNKASPEIMFNLGNALFKNGNIGKAILSYRKAARLHPRDPDINANLQYARDAVTGSNAVQPTILDRALEFFSLNEIAVVAAGALWIWLIAAAAGKLKPSLGSPLKPARTIAALIFCVSAAWLVAALNHRNSPTAVVIAREAIIKFGPLSESETAFTASDGTELEVLGRKDEWVQVSDRSNRAGWVNQRQVELF